jgi:hypothetical protein
LIVAHSLLPFLIPIKSRIIGAPAPKIISNAGIDFIMIVDIFLLLLTKVNMQIRNPNHNEVLVPDNINERPDEMVNIQPRFFLFLLFVTIFKPIAKQISEAFDIANALKSIPVGLLPTPDKPSRILSCATGIILKTCKITNRVLVSEK